MVSRDMIAAAVFVVVVMLLAAYYWYYERSDVTWDTKVLQGEMQSKLYNRRRRQFPVLR